MTEAQLDSLVGADPEYAQARERKRAGVLETQRMMLITSDPPDPA